MIEHKKDEINLGFKKYLIFSVKGRSYCIPLIQVKEVTASFDILETPKTPSYYRGLINVRGQIIPVVDLSVKLGFTETKIVPKRSSIVIFALGAVTFGVLVDEVLAVEKFNEEQIDKNSELEKEDIGNHLNGIIRSSQGELIFGVDLNSLLPKKQDPSEQNVLGESHD